MHLSLMPMRDTFQRIKVASCTTSLEELEKRTAEPIAKTSADIDELRQVSINQPNTMSLACF
jgi:hypothetical protein